MKQNPNPSTMNETKPAYFSSPNYQRKTRVLPIGQVSKRLHSSIESTIASHILECTHMWTKATHYQLNLSIKWPSWNKPKSINPCVIQSRKSGLSRISSFVWISILFKGHGLWRWSATKLYRRIEASSSLLVLLLLLLLLLSGFWT